MILIIESGSTKADWVCLDKSGTEINRWSIMGFNPYFHSSNFISQTLLKHPEIRFFLANHYLQICSEGSYPVSYTHLTLPTKA